MSLILSNALVTGLGGFFVGALGAPILLAAVKVFKLKEKLLHNMEKAGNIVGLELYKRVIVKIKDDNLRKETIDTLKNSPNEFDKGFDIGLDGGKI